MTPITWALLLLVLAIGLFALELFIPSSGVLGILAAAALIGSLVFVTQDQGLVVGLIYLVALAVLAPIVTVAAVNYWPYTPIGRRILNMSPDEKGATKVSVRHAELIGQRGVAITKMLPSGSIKIEGKSFDAVCVGFPVDAGDGVEVIRVDGTRIVVQRLDEASFRRPANQRSGSLPAEEERASDVDPLSRPLTDSIVDPFDDKLT